MSVYSRSQKQFIRNAFQSGLRADGRVSNQKRNMNIQSNILDNLAGSSHLSIEYDQCQIYTGVKLKLSQSNEQQTRTKIFLELSTMTQHNKQKMLIVSYLQQLLFQHFILKQKQALQSISIPNSKKHYLQIHIEVFILAQPHLSLLQPLFLSVQKALRTTLVPKMQCFYNQVTNQETVELTNQNSQIKLGQIDSLMVVGWNEGRGLLDLTPLQYQAVEGVWIVQVRGEKVIGLESLKGSIASQDIHRICKFALQNRK